MKTLLLFYTLLFGLVSCKSCHVVETSFFGEGTSIIDDTSFTSGGLTLYARILLPNDVYRFWKYINKDSGDDTDDDDDIVPSNDTTNGNDTNIVNNQSINAQKSDFSKHSNNRHSYIDIDGDGIDDIDVPQSTPLITDFDDDDNITDFSTTQTPIPPLTSISIPSAILIHDDGPYNYAQDWWPLPRTHLSTLSDIGNALCEESGIIVLMYDRRDCPPLVGNTSQTPACDHSLNQWCGFRDDSSGTATADANNSNCFNVSRVTVNDLIGDAISAVQFLKTNFSKIIDPSSIIPIGHSQGSSIATQVAYHSRLKSVASLMGSGVTLQKWITTMEQNSDTISDVMKDHDLLTFKLLSNGTLSGFTPVSIMGDEHSAEYWIDWMAIERNATRMAAIASLHNYLVLNSPSDISVPSSVYLPLHIAIESMIATHVNLSIAIHVIPDLLHTLVNYHSFYYDGIATVDTAITDILTHWIQRITLYDYHTYFANITQFFTNATTDNTTDDDVTVVTNKIVYSDLKLKIVCYLCVFIIILGCGVGTYCYFIRKYCPHEANLFGWSREERRRRSDNQRRLNQDFDRRRRRRRRRRLRQQQLAEFAIPMAMLNGPPNVTAAVAAQRPAGDDATVAVPVGSESQL